MLALEICGILGDNLDDQLTVKIFAKFTENTGLSSHKAVILMCHYKALAWPRLLHISLARHFFQLV